MEFHVSIDGWTPDLDAIRDAIERVDPSAVVDIDPTGRVARIAAGLDAEGLRELLGRTGHPVTADAVRQLPSICCGGCSG